jgi:hypothetical protein
MNHFVHKNIISHKGGSLTSNSLISKKKPILTSEKQKVESEYLEKFDDGETRIKSNKIGGFSDVPYRRSNIDMAPPGPVAVQGFRSRQEITQGNGLVNKVSKLPISLNSKKLNRNNIKLIL